jgi:hypothetical protein
MKKTIKKLMLNKETVRSLDPRNLHDVAGGKPPITISCREISDCLTCQ